MFILYLIITLVTLGSSTAGMDTNTTVYAVLNTMHNITGSVLGWSAIVAIAGSVLAFVVKKVFRSDMGFGCTLGCLVGVPLIVLTGTILSWLLTGGMLVNFSPVTGPTSFIFWIWGLVIVSLGEV